MAPRIPSGDVVLVSEEEPAREGEAAIVQVWGRDVVHCTLYFRRGGRVLLRDLNPDPPDLPPDEVPAEDVLWALRVPAVVHREELPRRET